MPLLLKEATLVEPDPISIEKADLRIESGLISERGNHLEAREGDEIIDLGGRVVIPGMVCAHTHLYSTLARGMPAPPRQPSNFKEILELVWWRLDRALDDESIYWSAMVGALDAARVGTTCLFDHHASPANITGSLRIVREAIEKIGLRAVLCYEVTDRGGSNEREKGLDENLTLLNAVRRSKIQIADSGTNINSDTNSDSDSDTNSGIQAKQSSMLVRGMVGAHASFTLSDESLDYCAELMKEFDTGLHVHVAEDRWDVLDAKSRYRLGVVERLAKHSALNNRTILAHGTHLTDEDIAIARSAGAWFAHNPRSNMNNQVGYAPVSKFGDRVVLGTDGIGVDMFEEARIAFFKSRDNRAELGADAWLRVLANNQRLASEAFEVDLGSLRVGSPADLTMLDYKSPTPMTAENFSWHLAFGINSASVESVMVAGSFVVRNRKAVIDEQNIYEQARVASEKLWARLRKM